MVALLVSAERVNNTPLGGLQIGTNADGSTYAVTNASNSDAITGTTQTVSNECYDRILDGGRVASSTATM